MAIIYDVAVRPEGASPGGGPGLRPFVETWKRLPLAVTSRLGPALVRLLPLH